MKVAMGPPPPKPPTITSSPPPPTTTTEPSNPSPTKPKPKPSMGPLPPVPKFSTPKPSQPPSTEDDQQTQQPPTQASIPPSTNPPPPVPKFSTPTLPQHETTTSTPLEPQPDTSATEEEENKQPQSSTPSATVKIPVPYTIPPWNHPPSHPFSLEVLKDGSIIDQFNVSEKGAYMFGRVDLCDFVLDHPTISRFHAVIQFKQSGEAYIYDLGSTHGTSVNKNQVKKRVYTDLHVGDVIRFGQSSRLYVFQGPTELMPPERDLKKIRSAKIREEMQDREASLLRAKQEAALADGISWGMTEDAIEEAEEDADEVTWQTYKGQLTERQQKTREKVIKRMEKVANMKKEIDAIRVKDIPQGGLTQGQQTQIARNEQRIMQLLEELESLEETLNESIQESIGARSGKVRSKKKGAVMEEEDDVPSDDDDEFYDRTKKPATLKAGEHQSVETADSLLDKKDAIMEEIENKQALIDEKSRSVTEKEERGPDGDGSGDPLDAYMTGLSSQLVLDTTKQLEKELSSLQSELDRIKYLLQIADPSGEAARKRELKIQAPKSNEVEISTSGITKLIPPVSKKSTVSAKPADSICQGGTPDAVTQSTKVPEVVKTPADSNESKNAVYTVTKPQWLGAVHDAEAREKQQDAPSDMQGSDDFVDYKDRKEVLGSAVDTQEESGIEAAAPGLILRKRKQVERSKQSDDEPSQVSTSSSVEAETTAADAVALLLKHKKGVLVTEEEGNESLGVETQPRADKKKSRRVLGPEKPAFLSTGPDYEAWVPPKGQSGDGRTSLNDRFGY